MLLHMKEAFWQNVKEGAGEAALLARPWGGNVSEIKTHVHIWHGTEDTLAPPEPVREMAGQLSNCHANFLEGKGHFLDAAPEVWESILSSVSVVQE